MIDLKRLGRNANWLTVGLVVGGLIVLVLA